MFAANMIDKNSPIPIYYQIYLIIKGAIDNKKFLEGDYFYSESVLCSMFEVSRSTIRKSLDNLEKQGLIIREHGKQTKVNVQKKICFVSEASRLTHVLIKKGLKITSIIRRVEKYIPSSYIAELLQANPGEFVYVVERVRKIGEQKIGLSTSYLKNTIPVELTRDMFNEQTSLFQILEDNGLDIGNRDEIIEAQIPTDEIVEILELDENTAIIKSEIVTYDINGNPFEYVVMLYNSKYYKHYVNNQSKRNRDI